MVVVWTLHAQQTSRALQPTRMTKTNEKKQQQQRQAAITPINGAMQTFHYYWLVSVSFREGGRFGCVFFCCFGRFRLYSLLVLSGVSHLPHPHRLHTICFVSPFLFVFFFLLSSRLSAINHRDQKQCRMRQQQQQQKQKHIWIAILILMLLLLLHHHLLLLHSSMFAFLFSVCFCHCTSSGLE